jgi:indole-3-glycerol phosphate synthase
VSEALAALAAIAERKQLEVEALRCVEPTLWAKAELLEPARDITVALRGGTVIAELKRRSPSGGALRPALDCAVVAIGYAAAGAAAISVLTDGPGFGGSLDDLAAVRAAVDAPVLRKDFIVAPAQVAEARVAGADWVLLIATLLDDAALHGCLEAVSRARAHAIVEVHDETEARRAAGAGAECIGVNNRDLRTLSSDLTTFARMRPLIPDSVLCIAESGVRRPEDVTWLIREGADAVLVGEALMRAPDPAAACAEMVAAAAAAGGRR